MVKEKLERRIDKLFSDIKQLIDFDDDRIADNARWIIDELQGKNQKPDKELNFSEIEEAFDELNFSVAAAEEKRAYNNLELQDFKLIAEKARNFLNKF